MVSEGKVVVEWVWVFDVEEMNEVGVKEMFSMVGNMGIIGIEFLIKEEVGLVV